MALSVPQPRPRRQSSTSRKVQRALRGGVASRIVGEMRLRFGHLWEINGRDDAVFCNLCPRHRAGAGGGAARAGGGERGGWAWRRGIWRGSGAAVSGQPLAADGDSGVAADPGGGGWVAG